MRIAVGQRWQYVDKVSNFIAEILKTSPGIVVKVVHVYNDVLNQKKLGTIFDSSCLENKESSGYFSSGQQSQWSWTYLENQDAIKE